jgi:hypothetical protein
MIASLSPIAFSEKTTGDIPPVDRAYYSNLEDLSRGFVGSYKSNTPIEFNYKNYLLEDRLTKILNLQDDWAEPGSVPPGESLINAVIKILRAVNQNVSAEFDAENITPTQHGTISLDFELNEHNILFIEIAGEKSSFFYEKYGDYTKTEYFNVISEQGIARIVKEIENFYGRTY